MTGDCIQTQNLIAVLNLVSILVGEWVFAAKFAFKVKSNTLSIGLAIATAERYFYCRFFTQHEIWPAKRSRPAFLPPREKSTVFGAPTTGTPSSASNKTDYKSRWSKNLNRVLFYNEYAHIRWEQIRIPTMCGSTHNSLGGMSWPFQQTRHLRPKIMTKMPYLSRFDPVWFDFYIRICARGRRTSFDWPDF